MDSQSSQPDWIAAEKIAALVEKALSPNAKVQHNVWLPVLGADRSRQCDVVITFGSEPRTSVAIVEVQKRKDKPAINTFHGWCQKMREVGAQHLFCVSEAGYPESIIQEVATRIGPTVRLLTLRDAEEGNFGFFMSPDMVKTFPKFTILSIGSIGISEPTPAMEAFSSEARVFRTGEATASLNITELVARLLQASVPIPLMPPHLPLPPPHRHRLLINEESGLWIDIEGVKRLVKEMSMDVEISYEREKISIPVANLQYRQEMHAGVLAWIGRAIVSDGPKRFEITSMAVPKESGLLSVSASVRVIE